MPNLRRRQAAQAMRSKDIAAVEEIVGHVFADKVLLTTALTHKSYANEHACESNGRLEYLGDSVLGLIVAELLYRARDEQEGVLTELRQHIVSRMPLSDAVQRMGLMNYYRLGKGAKDGLDGFGAKPMSDVFEALLGAIYLDGGIECARAFVQTHLIASEKV